MTVPDLTADQRREALGAAVAARLRRAEVKSAVTAGSLSVADVLELGRRDAAVAKIRVTDLLECLPGIGPVRAERILSELRIAPSRRVRGLGVHQCARLCDRLEEAGR